MAALRQLPFKPTAGEGRTGASAGVHHHETRAEAMAAPAIIGSAAAGEGTARRLPGEMPAVL